jgi:hypothetical protein
VVAFGRDAEGSIFASPMGGFGGNSGAWTQLSDGGVKATAGPSAVLLDVPTGPLVGHYAIVAKRADNMFHLTIRDKNGGDIRQDWSPIPGGIFSQSFSAPAITFVPQSSSVGPQRTLVVTGVGDNGVVWWAKNQLSLAFTYNHGSWTGFTELPGGNPVNQTFVGPPAITFACQTLLGAKSSIALAVMGLDPSGTRTFFSRKFTGTAWSGWSQVQNGTFHDGPALAGRIGCGVFTETALFGLGEDDQIWVTTQLSGGAAGFTPLPDAFIALAGVPSAVGTASAANVAALTNTGFMIVNSAPSP